MNKMRKLTQKEIDYINDKKGVHFRYCFILTLSSVEKIIDDMGVEKLRNSPYFIDQPISTIGEMKAI